VTAALDTPAGLRRCALALHALHPLDREWLLDQLGSKAAERVQRLLAELAELGFPRDASIVKQALAAHTNRDTVDAQAWATALSHEPPALVALAVHDLPDPRRDTVLQALGLVRERQVRQRLQEQRRTGQRAPRLKAAIDAALRDRLATGEPPRAASAWSRAWRRLRGASN
jgi:hypothetical protein